MSNFPFEWLRTAQGERAFVTTQSIKKMKGYLKEWALDSKGWRLPGSNRKNHLDDIPDLEHDKDIYYYYKERWINENGLEQRLIVTFSPVYQRYQASIRDTQVDRAMKKIENSTLFLGT